MVILGGEVEVIIIVYDLPDPPKRAKFPDASSEMAIFDERKAEICIRPSEMVMLDKKRPKCAYASSEMVMLD